MIPVGYYPCTQDAPSGKNVDRLIDEIMAQAELCEKTNYDGFYFTEHHQQDDGYLPNPVLMAGLVGARTTRIKVGTCIALAPLYHPIRLAEDCAVIDQATKGRFRLALGIGYQDIDFAAFGLSPKQRVRRSEETFSVLRDAWAGKKVSALSSDYQFKDVSVTPRPYQDKPDIWLAAWSEPGVKRAAKIADGWVVDPIQSISVVKAQADLYREECEKNGRKPFICLMRDAVIADTVERAKVLAEPTMETHRWYFEHGAFVPDEHLANISAVKDLSFDIAAKDRIIHGNANTILEQLSKFKEVINPDYLIIRMRHPSGPNQQQALDDIAMFGEQVIPKL
ncbi:MAG: LLM class flavin-dependent oxidoreductase [Candidatus Lindowbacteria bacterium]|nr:LLM class flavin-dependent oxidoreductase [Candidatus Lindowbacteria bacterium]